MNSNNLLEEFKIFVLTKVIPFFSRFILRWALKFVGSVLIYIGWEESQFEELIIGLLTFIFGAILSILFEKKGGNE